MEEKITGVFNLGRKVMYDGFTYDSVSEFADRYKISATKLMSHVRSGWTIYDSIRYQSACTYEEVFEVIGYKGVEDYVSKNRLSFPIFMRYFEETLDIKSSDYGSRDYIFKNGSNLIEFRGDRYRKILSLCNAYGIKENEVVDRIMLGERTLDVIYDMVDSDATRIIKDREGIFVDGIYFYSVNHVARHFEINKMALQSRLYHGDTMQIAVDKLRNNHAKYTYKGKGYKSLSEVARGVGVSNDRLLRAFRKTGDLAQAVEKAIKLEKTGKKRPIVRRENGYWNYAGIAFSSANKMDKAFGLVTGTVHRLVRDDGMNPEEAVDFAIDYKKAKEVRDKKKAELDAHAKKVYDELYNAK